MEKEFIPETIFVKKSCITKKMRKNRNYYFEEASPISVYAYGLTKKAEKSLKKLKSNNC